MYLAKHMIVAYMDFERLWVSEEKSGCFSGTDCLNFIVCVVFFQGAVLVITFVACKKKGEQTGVLQLLCSFSILLCQPKKQKKDLLVLCSVID